MNKTIRGIFVVATVGIVLYIVAKKAKTSNSGQIVLERLARDYGAKQVHKDFVRTADKGYLDAWADAIKGNRETFMYNGSVYYTQGGTKKS